MNLETINKLWQDKSDGLKDKWTILREDDVAGDCDDYALTVLYHVICGGSILKFWGMLLRGSARIYYVRTKNDIGHAVLYVKGFGYIDNWSKDFKSRLHFEKNFGHKFIKRFWLVTIAYKML